MDEAENVYRSLGGDPDTGHGRLIDEEDGLGRYEATLQAETPSTVFLKATYHPDWHAYVDGKEVTPFMVAPSFPAVTVPQGEHTVVFEYKSPPMRTGLFLLGVATLVFVGIADFRRDWLTKALQRVKPSSTEASDS
jgi:hypothetical protein